MLVLGPQALHALRSRRALLRERVVRLATERCGLPADAELLLKSMGSKDKMGRWRNALGYFSVRRRRKKDYNEVVRRLRFDDAERAVADLYHALQMRLFDSVDYPEDVEPL